MAGTGRAAGGWLPGALALPVALALLAGCAAGDSASPEPAPSPGEAATTEPQPSPGDTTTPEPPPSPGDTTTPEPAPDLAGDWTEPFELTLPGGWTVTGCEGERLDLCAHRDGRFAGDLELLGGYPLDAGEDTGDVAALAAASAQRFVEDFRVDRALGCEGFTFAAEEVVATTVGGQPASRAGFTLQDSRGRVVERVVNYFTVHGGTVWLVNVDAYVEEGGCLGPSEFDPSFQPEDLADFEPYLDALVAGTPLPPP